MSVRRCDVSAAWRVSRLAFKKRFPAGKWKAARQAAKSDADIADFFEDFDMAPFVDLRHPLTQAAMLAFLSPSVPVAARLVQAEVDAILLTPPAPGEIPER